MLTRLLACFALLSGLSAVSAPAQANYAEALATQMERSHKQASPSAQQACREAHKKRILRMASRPNDPCAKARPATIFLPTVQVSSDFALE
jgi:hypothetical protein